MTEAVTPPHPQLDELIAVLERLRAPGGCAWDREQTHESLVQYLIEETYELVDAIESGDTAELIEELGDVLYQVVFHSDIAAEAGLFTLEDVASHMTEKMIGRHPHVFGDSVADTPDAVIAKLQGVIKTAADEPELKKRLADLGAESVGSTPAELGRVVREQVAKVRPFVEELRLIVQ